MVEPYSDGYKALTPPPIPPERIIDIRPIVIQQPIERITERERIVIEPPVQHSPTRDTEPHILVVPTVEREVVHVHHVPEPTNQNTPLPIVPVKTSPEKSKKNQSIPEEKIKEDLIFEEPKNQSENQRKIKEKSNTTLILKAPETAPQATKPKHYKKSGRQRTEEKTKEVIIYRLTRGKWPQGLSEYMCWYYNANYILKGAKNGGKTKQWRAENRQGSKVIALRPKSIIVPTERKNA